VDNGLRPNASRISCAAQAAEAKSARHSASASSDVRRADQSVYESSAFSERPAPCPRCRIGAGQATNKRIARCHRCVGAKCAPRRPRCAQHAPMMLQRRGGGVTKARTARIATRSFGVHSPTAPGNVRINDESLTTEQGRVTVCARLTPLRVSCWPIQQPHIDPPVLRQAKMASASCLPASPDC